MRGRRWILMFLLLTALSLFGLPLVADMLPCGSSDPKDEWTSSFGRVFLGALRWLDRDRDDTRYAVGYDERLFRSIRPGTDAGHVVQLLGEPLARHSLPDEKIGWYYSAPGPSQNYLVRVLILSNDRVVARHSECYLD